MSVNKEAWECGIPWANPCLNQLHVLGPPHPIQTSSTGRSLTTLNELGHIFHDLQEFLPRPFCSHLNSLLTNKKNECSCMMMFPR
jgi:hypothetical protein